jgi:hypothetical protein
LGTPGEIDIIATGILGGVTEYVIAMDTTNGLNPIAPQNNLPPIDTLRVSFNNGVPPFQFTEIDFGLAAATPKLPT